MERNSEIGKNAWELQKTNYSQVKFKSFGKHGKPQ